MQPVAAALGFGVVEGHAQNVLAQKPLVAHEHLLDKRRLVGGLVGLAVHEHHGHGFDGLLVEQRHFAGLALVVPALVAHRAQQPAPEAEAFQKAQRFQRHPPRGLVAGNFAGVQQSQRQNGVVVGQLFLEPVPIGVVVRGVGSQQLGRQQIQLGQQAFIVRVRFAVVGQPNQAVGHAPQVGELPQVGHGAEKQPAGKLLVRVVGRAVNQVAQGPHRTPKRVLGANFVQVFAPEAEKVAEVTVVALHVVNIAQVDGQQVERLGAFVLLVGHQGHGQGAGIIVEAVACLQVGNAVLGVLHDAGVVGEPAHVGQAELGQQVGIQERVGRGGGGFGGGPGLFQHPQVLGPDGRPAQAAAVVVSPALQRGQLRGLAQQLVHGGGQRPGILKRKQAAPAFGQQLLGVPIGRGHHGRARAHSVGQSAAGNLSLVGIGHDVDSGGREVVHQLGLGHKLVDEHQVAVHAQLQGPPLELLAVLLAGMAHHTGMGVAQHHVHHVRVPGHDGRQGPNDRFQPLVAAQQPEAEQHPPVAEGRHAQQRVDGGHFQIGHAVLNELNFVRRYLVDVGEEVHAPSAHHHEPDRAAGNLLDNDFLAVRGLAQNGVQHRHQRLFEPVQQRQQVNAAFAPKNTELMLQQTHVGVAGVEQSGRLDIVLLPLLPNDELHFLGVLVLLQPVRVVQGHSESTGLLRLPLPLQGGQNGLHHVAVEGGDAALAGQVRGDIGDSHKAF